MTGAGEDMVDVNCASITLGKQWIQWGISMALGGTPTADADTDDGHTRVHYFHNIDNRMPPRLWQSTLAIAIESYTGAVDRNACTLASVLAHELMHVVGNPWTHDHSGQYIRCYRFTNSVESEVLHYLKQRYPSA